MFWFEPLPQLSQLVELLRNRITSSSLTEGMQRTSQAWELPEFCTSNCLSCDISSAVTWLGSWTSALSFLTVCGVGWSLSPSASCRCSRRGSLPLSVWSLLWFAPWSHTKGPHVSIYIYIHMCVYIYMYTHIHQILFCFHAQGCQAEFLRKRWPAAHWDFQQRKPKSSPIVRVFNCPLHSSLISRPIWTPVILLPEHLHVTACGISVFSVLQPLRCGWTGTCLWEHHPVSS